MIRSLALALSCVATACKDKQREPATAAGSAVRPMPRPSDGPLPQLPVLQQPDDPKRADKVAFGRALFSDPELFGGERSCASCHQPERGTGGTEPVATGAAATTPPRHAPTLWNIGFYANAFGWDGRIATLEAAAGHAAKLDAAAAGALAEYMQTFSCRDTAYDRFAAGEQAALTPQQRRGLDLFATKAGCVTCHAPPFFSTAMGQEGGVYFNVGIGTRGVAHEQVDAGRFQLTNDERDWAAFKPPSLRDITRSAPYFHDGSVATLDDAVRLMATGGIANKNLNAVMIDRGLSPTELADLVAFLAALDCPPAIGR
jgi:cytochrome c peroxidase